MNYGYETDEGINKIRSVLLKKIMVLNDVPW